MSEARRLMRLATVAMAAIGLSGQLYGEPQGQLLDPTRPKGWQAPTPGPLNAEAPATAVLQLQGTFSLGGERSAVISGQRVVVGDEVSGARVLAIKKNTVILQRDGEKIELASLVSDVKTPAGLQEGAR